MDALRSPRLILRPRAHKSAGDDAPPKCHDAATRKRPTTINRSSDHEPLNRNQSYFRFPSMFTVIAFPLRKMAMPNRILTLTANLTAMF
jgi:hypothetical protein